MSFNFKFYLRFFAYCLCYFFFLTCSNLEINTNDVYNDNQDSIFHYKLDGSCRENSKSFFPNGQWVLADVPCHHFSQLISMRIGCVLASGNDEYSIAVCVGTFDKISRIVLKPKVYYIDLTSNNFKYSDVDRTLILDLSSNDIFIREGECVALYEYKKTGIKLLKTTYYSGKCYSSAESPYFLPKSVFTECSDFYCFEYSTRYAHIEDSREESNSSSNRPYSRVAFIGTSYINHAYIPDWKVERPRSMAASVDECGFTSLVMDAIRRINPEATYGIVNDAGWQRGYKNYDFDSGIGKQLRSLDPDLIILVTGGNSEYTGDFKNAFLSYIRYLKEKHSNAEIIVVVGCYTTQKRKDMILCCKNQGVKYVDLIDINEASMRWRLGDWYVGIRDGGDNNENGFYGFSSQAVVGLHANDLGFCIAAHRCLQKAEAGSCIESIHSISINTINGNGYVSTPNCQWVSGGLVSLRVDDGVIKYIVVKDEHNNPIKTIKLNNNFSGEEKEYYLFFMPNSDAHVFLEFIQ